MKKTEFHLCPEVPDFLFHQDKTHALSKKHNSQHKSKHPAQSSDWEWSKCCTSHCRLSTALGNVGGKSQFDQVHFPILNKEKLTLFQRPEWYSILGTVTTNNLKERKKRCMKPKATPERFYQGWRDFTVITECFSLL